MMFPAYFSHSGNAKAKRMAHPLVVGRGGKQQGGRSEHEKSEEDPRVGPGPHDGAVRHGVRQRRQLR